MIGTKLNMSTADHPQTDGSSENFIGTMIGMIRAFCHKNKKDWDKYIAAIEFAYNDSVHATTGYTPFQLSIGRDPSLPVTMLLHGVIQRPILYSKEDDKIDPSVYLQRFASTLQAAKQTLRSKQQNTHQRLLARSSYPIAYDPGDYVYVEADGIRQNMLGTMDPRRTGPYRVLRKVGTNAYELDFGAGSRRHNPINEEKLSPYLNRETRLPFPPGTGEVSPSPPIGEVSPSPSSSIAPHEQFRVTPAPVTADGLPGRRVPAAATRDKTIAAPVGYKDLHEVTDFRIHTGNGKSTADVYCHYRSRPMPEWRPLQRVVREPQGFSVIAAFLSRKPIQHVHLLQVGKVPYLGRDWPFITSSHNLYAPGNKQYLVVYSNGEQEWPTNEEITTGERLAISTADALCLHVMRSRRQRLRVLNLCSGNDSARAAIKKKFPNAHIVTVDANPQCHADFTEDVRTWEPWLRFKVGYFDIIWGSPPCNDGTRNFALTDSIGQAVFSIIGKLQPQAWFVANPRGHLRDRPFMQPSAEFRNTCTYCKYGAPYRKETDIWSNVPLDLKHCAHVPCRYFAKHGRHPFTARSGASHGMPEVPRQVAYSVPERLLQELVIKAILFVP